MLPVCSKAKSKYSVPLLSSGWPAMTLEPSTVAAVSLVLSAANRFVKVQLSKFPNKSLNFY